jgi:hypothetical protein
MATATVLRQIVDTLEASAVEIEAEAREMYKSAQLNCIPNRHHQVISISPTHSWAKPNDSIWKEEQRNVTRKYQCWYAAASHLIREYAPESLVDFESLYKSYNSFSGSDGGFFNVLWLKVGVYGGNAEDAVNGYMELFEIQRSILLSIPEIAKIKELDLRRVISTDLVKSELEYADCIFRNQKKGPCERAACVLAGVALERYLKTWCEVCLVPLSTDKKPTLNTLIEALYAGGKGHIDLTQKNKLETMATIRNNCAHPGTVERSRVGELIHDVSIVLTWPMK